MKVLPYTLASVLCGCATTNYSPSKAFTPAQINQNVSALDGRTVRIQGYLRLGPELHLIEGMEGRRDVKSEVWESDCLTLKPQRQHGLGRLNGKAVEIVARVDKDYNEGAIDIGGCSTKAAIEVVKVVRVFG